jgi:branched-subunit amino acid transport protein
VTWFVIVAVGLGSLALRLGPLPLLPGARLSERTDRLVRHAGLGAIAALVALSGRQVATGSSPVPALVALAGGAVLAARGASMVRLLVVGAGLYAATALVVARFGG